MDTPQSVKLFQINEEDLSELERTLPQLASAMTPIMTNRIRVQLRRCQAILSSVRWEYGPPSQVTIIPCDGDGSPTD